VRLESFFENFELLAEAPNGVQKLRELILQLAVQGKLVEQDPRDEPAQILLSKTRDEQARLYKEGTIGRPKASVKVNERELPYEIPASWQWVRLADIGHDWGQKKPDTRFSYIDVSTVDNKQGIIGSDINILEPKDAPSRARKIVRKGTVIYSTVRPYLLNIAVIDREVEPEPIASTAFAIIHPYSGIDAPYLFYYLRSKPFIDFVESEMSGMAYPAVSDSKLFKGYVPLPPSNEQKRIVAKVDELMALCDAFEQRQQKRNEARARLNKASLNALTTSESGPDFNTHWRRVTENFHHLYTSREAVNELRQAILQLAVQGKLVSQDPSDEPAEALLEDIKHEGKLLREQKGIRRSQPLPPVGDEEVPFALPEAWSWVRLDNLCYQVTDGAHHTPTYIPSGVPFLSVKDISSGTIDLGNTRFISQDEHERLKARCNPEFGDLLLTKVGTTGIAKVIDVQVEFSIFVSLALLKFPQQHLLPRYFELVINSPLVKRQSEANTQGIGNKNLVLRLIKNFILPLPPREEQQRIVAKVDRLMTLCDELEAKLERADSDSQKLMEAVVHWLEAA
jgi:type I restriction enzyme, S subunit